METSDFKIREYLYQEHLESVLVNEGSLVVLKAHEESKQSAEKLNDLVAGILQVFVDARHAVPKHRCLDILRRFCQDYRLRHETSAGSAYNMILI